MHRKVGNAPTPHPALRTGVEEVRVAEWFSDWFGEDYLALYPHRDEADAERAAQLQIQLRRRGRSRRHERRRLTRKRFATIRR